MKQIKEAKQIILNSFDLLMLNDSDLIKLPKEAEIEEYDKHRKKLERKLHEVCINHRLALYLEKEITKVYKNVYKVDIEYNRYYRNQKYLRKANGEEEIVRPDILIHSRATEVQGAQHYLVIEAKKDEDSEEDKDIVIRFLEDDRYKYQFGATIIYKELKNRVIRLYYLKKDNSVGKIDL
ncbi:hypothetical protein M0R36_04015 [bacterium]|nr:hypothetical protein [bacterium]